MEKGAEASWILGTSGGGVNSSSSSSEPFDIEIALSRIRARAGPWHQLAALLPQLSSAGIDAMAVEVETGLERATQALWQTAAQVFASLESDGLFPAAALPAFDSGPGALALHELRNLPADARRGAAEYLATGGEMVASGEGILEAVDANLASTLARAYREWERRAREREGFSDAPGDVLAFKHWRDAAECRREDAKEEALKRGLAVAVTNTAKDRLESLSTEAIARVVPAAEAAAAAAAAGLLRTSAEGVSCWFFISVFFVLLFSQGRGFRGRQKKLIFSSFISPPPSLSLSLSNCVFFFLFQTFQKQGGKLLPLTISRLQPSETLFVPVPLLSLPLGSATGEELAALPSARQNGPFGAFGGGGGGSSSSSSTQFVILPSWTTVQGLSGLAAIPIGDLSLVPEIVAAAVVASGVVGAKKIEEEKEKLKGPGLLVVDRDRGSKARARSAGSGGVGPSGVGAAVLAASSKEGILTICDVEGFDAAAGGDAYASSATVLFVVKPPKVSAITESDSGTASFEM